MYFSPDMVPESASRRTADDLDSIGTLRVWADLFVRRANIFVAAYVMDKRLRRVSSSLIFAVEGLKLAWTYLPVLSGARIYASESVTSDI